MAILTEKICIFVPEAPRRVPVVLIFVQATLTTRATRQMARQMARRMAWLMAILTEKNWGFCHQKNTMSTLDNKTHMF